MSDISTRVHGIRQWLEKNNLDGIIIPHEDEYLSEYIPPENERLAWATCFTGSAGVAIITKDSAAIFVDGRYTVQVKEQVDSNIYKILGLAENPLIMWMKDKLPSGTRLGYDSRLHRINWVNIAKKELEDHINLIVINENPIDLLWKDRPSGNTLD